MRTASAGEKGRGTAQNGERGVEGERGGSGGCAGVLGSRVRANGRVTPEIGGSI